ncbi:hypothetical protein GCM10010277_77100 [Streptomyces longisporoflavus]|nr:hypothetical protein GCM10010277_77100 [Streptomyces longisporoflavus]
MESLRWVVRARAPGRPLDLITEAVRAALEEVVCASLRLLGELVDEAGGHRYGRPVRPGKNPTKPKTRILATGKDTLRLPGHLHRHRPYPTSSPTAGPADHGRVRQEPVPAVPEPHPVHHHSRVLPVGELLQLRVPSRAVRWLMRCRMTASASAA